MSNRLGRREPPVAPYQWHFSRLQIHPISEHSLFGDWVWKFDTLVPGRRAKGLNWALGVHEEMLASKQYCALVVDAKRVLLAYMVEKVPRPQTVIERGRTLRSLIKWMVARGYDSFSTLDYSARREYFEHVVAQYLDEDENVRVVCGTLDRVMGAITLIYEMREFFPDFKEIQIDVQDLRGFIWSGSGRKVGARDVGKIPGVPQEVFNPLIDEALRWVDVYSKDIIALVEIEASAAARVAHWESHRKSDYINEYLSGYVFSASPVTGEPWRQTLKLVEEFEEQTEEGSITRRSTALLTLRQLVSDLFAACTIVIQGLTGIRVSEILGLHDCQESDQTGLPGCVRIRPGVEGVNDVFHIVGSVYKGAKEELGVERQWVVGIRPSDSQYEPEVVRAIRVVLAVSRGWRKFSGTDDLFIYPASRGIPRSKAGVRLMTSNTLQRLQQRFMERRVTVPPRFSGWILSTHQYRTRFAQDIVRADPNSLPALREHFKHMSMHILETGYIGNDLELLRLVDDTAMRDAAALLFAMTNDDRDIANVSSELRKVVPTLLSDLSLANTSEEKAARLEALVASEGLRAWPCGFGTCLFRAEFALCHRSARGEYRPSAVKPLASERCADTCCVCKNLVVSKEHLPYWEERYQTHNKLTRVYRGKGNTVWWQLAKRRAKIALAIVTALGRNIDEGYNA